jgi:branched-chain amino acid aminotransferase
MVSVYDRCYLYGDGLFDSIPVWKRTPFKLDMHLDRTFRGMGFLKIDSPLTRDELKQAILDTIDVNTLEQGYLRVQVSRGEGEGADMWNKLRSGPYFMIYANHFTETNWISSEKRQRGLTGTVVSTRRTPAMCKSAGTKDCNFLNSILASIERESAHAEVGILLDIDGNVAEGIAYNICIVRHGTIYTPTLAAALPGITRQVLLEEIGPREGFDIVEADFGVFELCTADEVFVISSILLGVGIVEIDGRQIGAGTVGPVTRSVGDSLIREMESEASLHGKAAGSS